MGKECNSEILVKRERLSSGHHMDGWYSPELQEAVVICAGSAQIWAHQYPVKDGRRGIVFSDVATGTSFGL